MNFKEEIINYIPYNAQEEKDKQVMLEYINKFDDILVRTNEIAHMTSSSWIINKNRDKVLMIFHNIYNSWSWTGGHVDGESNFLDVAIKEAKEETSVINIKPITNEIIALDILPVWGHIKRGKYVSSHQHLNVTYLLEADENDELSIKADENSGVKWVPFNEVKYFCSEPEMLKVYNKITEKIRR